MTPLPCDEDFAPRGCSSLTSRSNAPNPGTALASPSTPSASAAAHRTPDAGSASSRRSRAFYLLAARANPGRRTPTATNHAARADVLVATLCRILEEGCQPRCRAALPRAAMKARTFGQQPWDRCSKRGAKPLQLRATPGLGRVLQPERFRRFAKPCYALLSAVRLLRSRRSVVRIHWGAPENKAARELRHGPVWRSVNSLRASRAVERQRALPEPTEKRRLLIAG
jgi:hypothetical protein